MQQVDAIVEDVLGGNRERYRELVEAYEPTVRLLLAALLPNPSVVDDLIDEVFVTAYLKLGEFRKGGDFRAWVRGLARHHAMNERRRFARHRALNEKYRAEIDHWVDPAVERLAGETERNLVAEMQDCLQRLTAKTRRLVEQYYFEDIAGPALAAREGRSESSLRVALFRARAAILDCLRLKGAVPGE